MRAFATPREAKEYLIERILMQAQRDGVSLSKVERRMLHFSERATDAEDTAEVNEELERHYDLSEYEKKIARLSRRALSGEPGAEREWSRAVRVLRQEDHYLLVLIDASAIRPRGDFVLTGLGIVAALLAAVMLASRW